MEKIKKFFQKHDLLARYLGMELLEVGPGRAVARMPIREEHLNGVRTVHGGALFSLADFTFAAACNSYGNIAVAIQASISFVRAVSTGVLTAVASEVAAEKALGNYEVRITDETGELVAIFHGVAYRKRDSLIDTFGQNDHD